MLCQNKEIDVRTKSDMALAIWRPSRRGEYSRNPQNDAKRDPRATAYFLFRGNRAQTGTKTSDNLLKEELERITKLPGHTEKRPM